MLLGKTRLEMLERVERIKDFSELGKFFDYPVYTYSSGMNARLGFSVAMETEPEVLLIDEVLGVGDAGFAAKSQKALEDKFSSNRTVILISHNTETIKQMCDRCVWIEKGRTVMEGHPEDVTRAYIGQLNREAGIS
jgi:lipopolysaccharide transport system ATP-binding protein